MSCPVLLGDVGGTNARLALLTDGGLGTVTRYEVADHPDPLALFSDFIARRAGNARPLQAVFAVAGPIADDGRSVQVRSEEHTSELQSLMRISYAVFCLKKKKTN